MLDLSRFWDLRELAQEAFNPGDYPEGTRYLAEAKEELRKAREKAESPPAVG